jgi:HEAT repeat protein
MQIPTGRRGQRFERALRPSPIASRGGILSARYALPMAVAFLACACSPARAPAPNYSVTVDLTESIHALGSDDLEVSEPAAQRIESVGAAALPVLERVLRNEDAAIRARAAEIAGAIGEPAAVPMLIRAASDPEAAVRAQAVLALGSLKDERGRATIEAALGDGDANVRRAAADACATLCRSHAAFARLAEMALREQPIGRTLIPRQSLKVALQGDRAEIARAAVLEAVEPALSPAGDAALRGRAALLLVDLGDPRAPKALADAARSNVDVTLRAQVVLALGVAGDETAVPVLRDALERDAPVPRPIVCRSLHDLARRGVRGAEEAQRSCPEPSAASGAPRPR